MGSLRIPGKKTLVLEIARRCMEAMPDYPSNAWRQSGVQTGDNLEPELFWATIYLHGVGDSIYYVHGEVNDWRDPAAGGTCEVAERRTREGEDVLIIRAYFTWRMVDFKIEVELVDTESFVDLFSVSTSTRA
jgi:hypothetical protein